MSGIIIVFKMTQDSFRYLNSQWKFVTIYLVTWGRGYPEIVTNGDIGGGGPKIAILQWRPFWTVPYRTPPVAASAYLKSTMKTVYYSKCLQS